MSPPTLSLLPMLVVLSLTLVFALPYCVASDEPISAQNFDFRAWNSLLQKYVVPGFIDNMEVNMVDYYKVSKDSDYTTAMVQLESANTSSFSWAQYHAFWINAYNFAVVRAIIEHPCKMDMFPGGCGPITSIRQCNTPQPSAFVVIWSTKVTTIAGVEMTILEILQKLHEPPAPWQVDARFHSALTAGSVSSPDLSVAFGYPTADLLDAQLNASMATWLQNPRKGSLLHHIEKRLIVSATFRWDLRDFTANGKGLWWWLHNYGTPSLRVFPVQPTITYMSYDWRLNGEVGQLCASAPRPCYPWWALLTTVLAIALFLVFVIGCCVCTRILKRRAELEELEQKRLLNDLYSE